MMWGSFYLLVGHVYIIFGDMSLQISCSCIIWVAFLLSWCFSYVLDTRPLPLYTLQILFFSSYPQFANDSRLTHKKIYCNELNYRLPCEGNTAMILVPELLEKDFLGLLLWHRGLSHCLGYVRPVSACQVESRLLFQSFPTNTPWEAADDGLGAWASATHMEG